VEHKVGWKERVGSAHSLLPPHLKKMKLSFRIPPERDEESPGFSMKLHNTWNVFLYEYSVIPGVSEESPEVQKEFTIISLESLDILELIPINYELFIRDSRY
jgi:hypothetical protein